MGRAAGAVLTAVAPEAKVASKAAGAAGHRRRRPPAADPRVTAPGSPAARQRQAIEDIKAKRTPEPEPAPAPASPPPASPGGGLSLPATPAAVGTGSGFLLGVFAWALGLAYLQGGPAGVKKFLAAKFLNK